ncbi:MAG: hypothetical protein RL307_1019, partial [Pseudomonadota bacterium]
MLADRHDPIVAVATASGKGAIGVVRVSATGLLGLAQRLLGREPQARHATLMHLRDGADQPIDQVLMLWFPAPHSYTGEDVLELQGHGGP